MPVSDTPVRPILQLNIKMKHHDSLKLCEMNIKILIFPIRQLAFKKRFIKIHKYYSA